MEKITTVVDKKTIMEFSKKWFVLVGVGFGFGLVCIAMGIVFTLTDPEWQNIIYVILIILGALLIAFSGMLLGGLIKKINLYKNNGYEATYEFKGDFLQLTAFRGGEQFQNAKIRYNEIDRYNITKSYVILKLKNGQSLPLDNVSGLTEFLESKGIPLKRR